jgi:hypothetical protein
MERYGPAKVAYSAHPLPPPETDHLLSRQHYRDRAAVKERPQIFEYKLRLPRGRCWRHDTTRDHDLHQICTALDSLGNSTAQVAGSIALAAEVPTVSVGSRDRWTCTHEGRKIWVTPEIESDKRPITEASQRRHTADLAASRARSRSASSEKPDTCSSRVPLPSNTRCWWQSTHSRSSLRFPNPNNRRSFNDDLSGTEEFVPIKDLARSQSQWT